MMISLSSLFAKVQISLNVTLEVYVLRKTRMKLPSSSCVECSRERVGGSKEKLEAGRKLMTGSFVTHRLLNQTRLT